MNKQAGINFLCLTFCLLAAGAFCHAQEADTKLGKATIAGVSVSGLTPKVARQRLEQKLANKLNSRMTLTDGRKRVQRPRRALGIGLDLNSMVGEAKAGKAVVPLRFRVNRVLLQKALRNVAPAFRFAGQDVRLIDRGGKVTIKLGQRARVADVGKSAVQIADAIEKDPARTRLSLVVVKKAPKVTPEMLQGVTGRLSRFITRFNPKQAKRTHNIRLALQSIDGKVLKPGEVFSLNQTVGERTHAHGYLTAPVFVDKKLVPGIGGGVSQVTGTLFNAALMAGLPIVEYRTHAKPVHYLPAGRDATVAWGRFDMKFKNNTSAPVYIAYKAQGGKLIAALYGKPTPGQKIRLIVHAQSLGPHSKSADLYRVIKRSGKVVRKEKIGHSAYDWKPQNAD